MLVEAHGPVRNDLDFRVCVEFGQFFELLDRHARDLAGFFSGVLADELGVFLEGDRSRVVRVGFGFAVCAGVTIGSGVFFQRMHRAQAVADVGDAFLEIDVLLHELGVDLFVRDDVVGNVVQDRQISLRLEDDGLIGQIKAAVFVGGQHGHLDVLVGQATVGDAAP